MDGVGGGGGVLSESEVSANFLTDAIQRICGCFLLTQ